MPRSFYLLIVIGVIVAVGSLFFWLKQSPTIVVMPKNALLDESLEICVEHLPANEPVTLELSRKDTNNNLWLSHAVFQADDKGRIQVAKQAPLSGSYTGIDPMGLFWSMAPTGRNAAHYTLDLVSTINPSEFVLQVFSGEKLRAQITVHQRVFFPDIAKKEIRENGIVGTLFYSKSRKNPGIIAIPGSGNVIGVSHEGLLSLLALHGYTVFFLQYFGAEGLPKTISMIPLEYFENAMLWLKKQPQVDGGKIALMGQSRGGELALILASLFPGAMDAAIAISAPSVVYGDFSSKEKSSWTYKHKPLPFMPLSGKEIAEIAREGDITLGQGTIEHPIQHDQIFLHQLKMKKFAKNVAEASIPVEKIRCPLLILAGDDDKLWPSSVYGKNIIERLDAYGSSIKKKFIIYPHAGNNILILPYVPSIDLPTQISSGLFSLHGGTLAGNAYAHKEAWREILRFLDETLHN